MLTCHYSDILRILRILAGLDWPLADDEEAIARISIDRHLHKIKSEAKWPELFAVEERQYRADYNSGTTYAAPTATVANEVFDEPAEKYYQNLRSTLNNPPSISDVENSAYWAECKTDYSGSDWATGTAYTVTNGAPTIVRNPANNRFYQCHTAHTAGASFDATKFGILTPFDQYISLTQTGKTAIGDVQAVYDANPHLTTRATELPWFLSDNGIQVLDGPAKVWVEFEVRLPRLTGEVWSSTATYAVGEQVQFSTTTNSVEVIDFYTCAVITTAGQSPATTASSWTLVELPNLFRDYLGAKAAMDLLTSDSDPLFLKAESEAADALVYLNDNLYRNQRQVPRTRVLTY